MAAMEAYTARLASFNKSHSATRKRTSEAKGAKSLKWPHKSPTPAQLARAGFYYHPTASCPDNATCFLCQSNLDGWEEDDDPIVEHLKHSPACGWAITAYIEQSIENGNPTEEDPMSEGMLSARTMTFGTQWPHENKRGWTCKTQKMVAAGWYYCPTTDSDDFVKCAYCNLSLDGWEPKDNPFNEHQRRSPECRFFMLSTLAKSKPGRSKKGRMSTSSRLSTVSNITAVSEGLDITESQEKEGNNSMMSPTGSVISTKTGKGSKKGAKAKETTAKPKSSLATTAAEEHAQASSFIEPEDDDFEVKVEPNAKKSKKSRKRKSDEMAANTKDTASEDQGVEVAEPPPPPTKRRAIRTRSSVLQSTIVPVLAQKSNDDDMHMTDNENMPPTSAPASKKGAKASRSRASSAVRKASATSTASMASLRATIPDDDDIDAVLEAGLDRPLTDDENEAEQLEAIYPKTRRLTRTKPGSRNATASIAPVRRATRTSVMASNVAPIGNLLDLDAAGGAALQSDLLAEEAASILAAKSKATKGKSTRIASTKQPTTRDTNIPHEEYTADKLAVHEDEALVGQKPSRSRQPSRQLPQRRTRASDLTTALENINLTSSVNNSMLESFTAEDDSGHETDRSVASQSYIKRSTKKGTVTSIKNKAGKKAQLRSRKVEDIIQPNNDGTAIVLEQQTPMEIDYPKPADPKPIESESIEEDIEPKKKSAKSTKAKLNKPAMKKVQPSSPPAKSPKRPLPDVPAPITQATDTDETSFHHAQADHEAMSPTTEVIVAPPAPLPSARTTPTQTSPRQSSDAENEPPSSRPSRLRPPLSACSPLNHQTACIPLAASTPIRSPFKRNISKLQSSFPWTAVDLENFLSTAEGNKENEASVLEIDVSKGTGGLPSPEKQMTVEQWILFNAKKSEEKLRSECERLVGKFEGEGVRALKTLEGIACVD